MDKRLSALIKDYLASVSRAVQLLAQGGISQPCSNTEWACNDVPQTGILPGGVKYYKHGYGCAVHLNDGTVDFDFGENGENDGFDTWRLSGFAQGKLSQYGFESEDEVKMCFNAAVAAGELRYSGYILYYLHETASPSRYD